MEQTRFEPSAKHTRTPTSWRFLKVERNAGALSLRLRRAEDSRHYGLMDPVIGAIVLVVARSVKAPTNIAALLGGATCFGLRIVAVWQHWHLPTANLH